MESFLSFVVAVVIGNLLQKFLLGFSAEAFYISYSACFCGSLKLGNRSYS